MDTIECKNVKSITVDQIIETVDKSYRSIIIKTESGTIELVLTATDPDALKLCL